MATYDWDAAFDASPADTEGVNLGASRIRDLKLSVKERMLQGGHLWAEATNTNDGKHAVNADGSGTFTVYKSDKSTSGLVVTDTYIRPHSSLEVQNSSGDPITRRRRVIAWAVVGTLVTGDADIPMIELRNLGASEGAVLVECGAIVKTAPTGDSIIVDLEWSPAADVNPNTNLTSVFTGPTLIEIADGAYKGTITSGFAKTAFAADDVLLPTITQVGSTTPGTDITIYAVFEWPS